MKKRVIFLGNHTVGVRSLGSLMEVCHVELVVAHPADPEDGLVYESVHDFAMRNRLPVFRSTGRNPDLYRRIEQIAPDLIWTADYRYLLPQGVIDLASDACINLHPSLLPAYRGRAPLNWAILNGEREVGLTAHLIDEGVDTGAVLCQKRISMSPSEDVGDVLRRLEPIYESITREVIQGLESGDLVPVPQPEGDWPTWPRRTPGDGCIDWNRSSGEIVNLIRAVADPYPGARTRLCDSEILIWKATALPDLESNHVPGSVLSVADRGFMVQAGSGQVEVTSCSPPDLIERIKVGDRFVHDANGM